MRTFGGAVTEVVLHGNNYDEAAAEAERLGIEQGLTKVHPFDDPLVIAGQVRGRWFARTPGTLFCPPSSIHDLHLMRK